MSSDIYEEIYCPNCNEKAFVTRIDHIPDKEQYRMELRCLNHKNKLEIPEDQLERYLYDIFLGTLKCPYCKSKYPEFVEIESYLKFSGRFQPVHLLLKKFCVNCKKEIIFEFTNRIYTKFFDLYYEYLKGFVNNESLIKYQNFLKCHECNSAIIAKNIGLQDGRAFVEGNCISDGHHKVALADMSLDHQPMWLGLLNSAIYICQICHSTDITFHELDFTLKKMFVTFGLRSRWIMRVCNKCQDKNLLMMYHGHYEIYRRILKELKSSELNVGKLYCKKCNSDVILEKLDVKKGEMVVHLACEQNHKTELNLDLKEKKEWIDGILNSINKCSKCWSTKQKGMMVSHKLYGYDLTTHEFKIEIKCLKCGKKRSVMLNNIIFDEIMDFFYK